MLNLCAKPPVNPESKLGSSVRRAVQNLALLPAVCFLFLGSAFQGLADVQKPYVVGNDRGGYLHDRLIELENLQRNRVSVEIRGRVCFSTCTMFLGLPDTCVDPETTFGFHGPSQSGRRLSQEDFDYFSKVMADFYPEPLKSWFMNKGRNRISGVYKIKGAEIIRMGIAPCRTA